MGYVAIVSQAITPPEPSIRRQKYRNEYVRKAPPARENTGLET
jgi:hypothetical protein